MANDNLPGVIANFPDGGLTVQRTRDLGDSVLVIGTAEDGPKNEPVPIQNLEQLSDTFGRFGQGTLVRGVFEVWNATDTPVDVRGLRIGNGTAASLGIEEASGYVTRDFSGTIAGASGLADPTFSASGRLDLAIDALTLTAKYEGSRYNGFTVRVGFDDDPNSDNYGQNCILVYNPFTGIESSFSYDYYNTTNISVNVHNTTELVDAINADSNMNPYIEANTTELSALYEITASGNPNFGYIVPSSGAAILDYYATANIPQSLQEGNAIETQWNQDGTPKKVTLNLHHITTCPDNNQDNIPDAVIAPDPTYGIPSVIKIGPIGMTWSQNIPTAGNQLIDLLHVYEIAEASGALLDTSGKDFAMLDNYPVNRNESQAPGSVIGNTIIRYDGSDAIPSQYRQYVKNGLVGVSSNGTTAAFNFRARLELDITNWAGGAVDIPSPEHDATTVGREIPTRVYETVAGVTSETRKPCQLTWTGSTATVTFTDTNQLPSAGTIITVDYMSVVGTLTEYNTRIALENTRGATNDFENYFVTGDRVYFGGPHETDIRVSYNYKRDYDIPGDVSITNHNIGKIEFTNPSKMPLIHSENGTRIGLNYTYRPEWIAPSGTESLAGGANGTNMTGKQTKIALGSSYTAIENYNVDIILPMGAYLDSVMEDYSLETGILREMNAGYHTQLAELLDKMANNVNETIGIIGVSPASSNSISDVSEWVKRLTIPNSNDRLRAANYMPTFNSKWVQVVVAEPGVSAARLNVASIDYFTNGAAFYAGLITSQPAQLATTNKYMGRSLLGLRYTLSRKQLNDLVISRYVCFMNKPGTGPVVVKDVTAALIGSDYDKLTTLRIVKLVMKVIREVADPYIGDVNTPHKRNAMYTAINAALQRMTRPPNQALRDYDFQVDATAEEQREGIVRVECVLVPVFCMERIMVTMRLRNTL